MSLSTYNIFPNYIMKDEIKKFYDSLGIDIKKTKENSEDFNRQLLYNLYKTPPKVKDEARTQDVDDGVTHQADILFLPTDNNFKYALVVTDIGSRGTDAEPLKTKTATEILTAFKTIYKRKVLSMPKYMLQVDSGGEFKGVVKKYFDDNDVVVRYGKPDHHQSQASVEAKNQIIGKALLMRMTAQELNTKVVSREWVEFLPIVIKALNERLKRNNKKVDTLDMPIRVSKNNSDLLDVGVKVRVKLDAPVDVATGQKVNGRFRSSDIKYMKLNQLKLHRLY